MSHSQEQGLSPGEHSTTGAREVARNRFIWRLQLAQALLKAGLSPAQVRRLGRGSLIERLFKYSPDQPRVPAGSGRTSGEWTSGSTGQSAAPASARHRQGPKHPAAPKPRRDARPNPKASPRRQAAPPAPPKSPQPRRASASVASAATAVIGALGPRNPGIDLGTLSESALSGVAAFLRGLAVAPEALAGAAVGGFGLALIPTNGPLGRWVKLPGPGAVSVFVSRDEPGLTFRYTTADGAQHEWKAAPAVGGVYLGPDGKVIARWTKVAGALGLVVSTAALLDDKRTKLCPATVPDAHGPHGLTYEQMMKWLYNPGNPTPNNVAYGFYGPAGNLVKIDDCQQGTGILAEYKGPGFAYHLAKQDPVWRGQLNCMLDQAQRQTDAVQGKPLIWFFAEWTVYRFMKKEYAEDFPRIQFRYFPMPGQRRRK